MLYLFYMTSIEHSAKTEREVENVEGTREPASLT